MISAFISPTEEIRNLAKEIIGKDNFIEIFVNTPLDVCEKRDVKGLYKKARQGDLKNFTGISSPFEPPLNSEINLDTNNKNVAECVDEIWDLVWSQIALLPKDQLAV